MKMIYDTSVIASLFLEEEISERSKNLIDICDENDVEIICTELVNYELANVLVKNKTKDPGVVMNNFRKTFPVQLLYNKISEELSFMVSKESGLSFYDSFHVSMSRLEDGFLVTNDKKIIKKVDNAIDVDEAIELVSEEIAHE